MDNLRGTYGTSDLDDQDGAEDAGSRDGPPLAIGQDERRMQVRAYNHWAGLLNNRKFPDIEDLEPAQLPDFGPYSVLLDFSTGFENPTIAYLGDRLSDECGTDQDRLSTLDAVPSRSLLSRITDHYMQILANQAPIGFEAEFVNQRGLTVLYRGILLPFSSDDDTIDFIYGVINWKELAEQSAADELLLEIDQALEARPARSATKIPALAPLPDEPLASWADGPATSFADHLPRPVFGDVSSPGLDDAGDDEWNEPVDLASYAPAPSQAGEPEMALVDWLAAARETAHAASGSEDRTRGALYLAIGQAWDFALAAADASEDFAALVADAGLTMQDRAPMTPVVKLVFGTQYDKTRLTEFATALTHAKRIGLPRGALAEYLRTSDGGLKGVVKTERALRRSDTGTIDRKEGPGKALVRRLRALPQHDFAQIAHEGSEFALVLIRREAGRDIAVLGEVPEDAGLVQKAARKLIA
jgi:hypothetical protein